LAAAGRLARAGYKVTVVEKAATPGGRTSRLMLGKYAFDAGPTLFLMPQVFRDTYAALGERMEDHLDLTRLDPTYRVHFHDGTSLDLTAGLPKMQEQLERIEPGSGDRFLRFLEEGRRHFDISLRSFVGRNFPTPFSYFSLRNLPLMFQVKALTKHAANTARYFRDPRLQAAFTFQNMYLGLSPYDAPATFSLLQYTELAHGVWFPRGGMYSVIRSLAGIAEGLGVRFRYNSPAARIDVDGGRATGVTLEGGERLQADVVVSNADLPYTYAELLPPERAASRMQRMKYTSSAFIFYWAVRGERSSELLHHNVFLADHRYRESFDTIFRNLSLPEEPSFYVCAPTRTESTFAPPEGDSLMVLVPVGHLGNAECSESNPHSQRWDARRERARQAVLLRLGEIGITGLEERIVDERVMDPARYRDELNLMKGAAFGLSHNFMQVGYLRPRNRHARYRNLYFVGASTHPGTGLPIVLISARLAVERILSEQAPARVAWQATRAAAQEAAG
jgi:phytoene desaturase